VASDRTEPVIDYRGLRRHLALLAAAAGAGACALERRRRGERLRSTLDLLAAGSRHDGAGHRRRCAAAAACARRYDISGFEPTYYYVCMVVVLLAYVYALVLLEVVHGGVQMQRAIPAGVLALLVLIGNPMGKVRRNFFIGIRTPWTLASESVWYATHRLAARLMVASGLLGLLALSLGASH
jgi:hypothetical protein